MRGQRPVLALIASSVTILACITLSNGQTPVGSQWWPSEWGADDERGAVNRITPEKMVEAAGLIKIGKAYHVGQVYEAGMPLVGNRHFKLTIPGMPTHPAQGKNRNLGLDEMVSAEIGQAGTQMDGLGHVGVQMRGDAYFYNGFKMSEFGSAYGLKKLGVENIGIFFTRGVLLDVAGSKGVDRLEVGYPITPGDLQKALDDTGLEITPGDVVLIRTGHAQLWMKDNETYKKGEPGIDMDAARWLTDRKVSLIGADNWAIEVWPHPDPDQFSPVHQWTLTRHGIYHLENMNLEELAADKVYEFAFVLAPLPLKGATGSPGNPVAIR